MDGRVIAVRGAALDVAAPAIANAIFAAVGVRLRHLPMLPAALRQAHARASGAQ
jgi:CO/xanthine dehydrogenase Mo-binding subunit